MFVIRERLYAYPVAEYLRTALFWVTTTTCCVIAQKSAVLIYFEAEA
jgi:hypothetical protein